jgi:hypothetical protein
MSVCTHKILAHNENGYVSLCQRCSHYQIAFISTILTLTEEQYSIFKSQVTKQLQCSKNEFSENHKTFCIHTFSENTRLILSLKELQKLVEILEEAEASLEVSNLMRGNLQTIVSEFQKNNNHPFSNQINLN